jgi:hypothetical protein
MELVRRGENDLDNNWGGNVEADPPHPSGIVEKRVTGEISVRYQPNRRFWLTIGGEYSQVWNVNHVSELDEDNWRLELELWFLGFEKSI